MIYKDYIYYSRYLRKVGSVLTILEDYIGGIDGYFQEHPVGLVLCDSDLKTFFQIDSKKYDISTLSEIKYLADGENRTVEFISLKNTIIDVFEYKVFWVDEADMLEFAFDLPDDIERDLLKFISDKIKALRNQVHI